MATPAKRTVDQLDEGPAYSRRVPERQQPLPQLDLVRIGTLLRLYDLHDRSNRSTSRLDLIEAALSLTLGEKRAAESEAKLLHAVLSDARRTINRSECNSREAASKNPLPDAVHRRVAYADENGSTTVELVSHDTPESQVVAAETLRELSAFASSIGAHGPRCLHCLLRDKTAAQTAALAGVSVATVERTWKALRAHTRDLVSRAA